MDKLERAPDPVSVLQQALAGMQSGIWTAMPAIVLSYNAAKMTAEVQVAVQARVRGMDKDGTVEWVSLPPLVDCPVMFPGGGGFTLTFPIAKGDECLVVFASRCIDAWWQSGGASNVQPDLRMHDLSDGFVIAGVRSQARLLPSVSATNVELRNDAGTNKISLTPAGTLNVTVTGDINLTAGGTIKMTAPKLELIGDVDAKTGYLKHKNVHVGSTHKHSGVTTGSGNSGNPV